jgi:hypothetical protein
MSDDYLWDRSGPPDPEVARLEELLRPLGQQENATVPTVRLKADTTYESTATVRLKADTTHVTQASRARLLRVLIPLAAAAVVLLAVGGWWLAGRSRPTTSWEVIRFEETPTASRRITGRSELPVGGSLETTQQETVLIKVADIGNVNVEPLTRVRLIGSRAGDHRLQLVRGTLHATILAPPGQFAVETASSTVVDLGCAYTLTVDDDGAGLVTVTLGWVGFEWRGRESFIPAGFSGQTRPAVGPGTPYHVDSSPAFRRALETIDFRSGAPDTGAAVGLVLDESIERDEVTLWHLLTRVPMAERDRVFDRLARFVAPPAGVTREGVRAGRRDMLDQWWDALGLGTASWWRTWKQAGPEK